MLEEEGDVIREYNAKHEENFLSSGLREDLVEQEQGKQKVNERIREGERKKGQRGEERKREEGKEENETVSAERWCVGLVSAEAFDIFSQGEDLESCGGTSWCDPLVNPDDVSDCEPEARSDVSAVLVVSDVLVSPSSVVTECFDDVSLDLDREFLESLSFSFSKKRPFIGTVFQEIMRYEGSPAKTSPLTRRRMILSSPQQSSLRRVRSGSGRQTWRYKEAAGVPAKRRSWQRWRIT